jgi:hypothetical protein
MTTGDCQLIFTLKPDAFHDGREGIGVDLLEIDVGALMNWLNTNRRRPTIMYVTFTNASTTAGSNAVNGMLPGSPSLTNDYPAVRLVNGNVLTLPFTLATDRPIYLQGSYNNKGTWQPAALLGDAITFLSKDWSDGTAVWTAATMSPGSNNSYPVPSPPLALQLGPAATMPDTIFAAIAAGNSPTPCDPTLPTCSAGPYFYGGGLENFPRFLENWNSTGTAVPVIYRGSLVALFASQFAARHAWSWKSVYHAPARDWAFDTNFRNSLLLPPGTPVVGTISQVAFRPVY